MLVLRVRGVLLVRNHLPDPLEDRAGDQPGGHAGHRADRLVEQLHPLTGTRARASKTFRGRLASAPGAPAARAPGAAAGGRAGRAALWVAPTPRPPAPFAPQTGAGGPALGT